MPGKNRFFIGLWALLILVGFCLSPTPAGAEPESETTPTVAETTPAVTQTTAAPLPDSALLSVGDALTEEDLTFRYGEKKTLSLDVVNEGTRAAHSVTLTAVISNDAALFPFKITRADWTESVTNDADASKLPKTLSIHDLSAQSGKFHTGHAAFTLDVRSDAPGGYYPLRFTLQYVQGQDTVTREIVLEIRIENSALAEGKNTAQLPMTSDRWEPEILCSTAPQEVMAGESFTLTLTVTNPSPDVTLSGLRLMVSSLQEGIFLPVSGASALFIDTLGPGVAQDLTLEMNTPAELQPQQYGLTLKLEYADDTAELHALEKTVQIPVHQPAVLTLSDITLVPETGLVNGNINLLANLYNTGSIQIRNVLVRLESQGTVLGEDYFAGNIQAGATSMMDIMITPLTAGELPCTLKVSYEDDMGRSASIEKDFVVIAQQPSPTTTGTTPTQPAVPEDTADGPQLSRETLMIGIAAAALLLILLTVFILLHYKRKHIRRSMDHYLDKE